MPKSLREVTKELQESIKDDIDVKISTSKAKKDAAKIDSVIKTAETPAPPRGNGVRPWDK
jgi:hypothetical protein